MPIDYSVEPVHINNDGILDFKRPYDRFRETTELYSSRKDGDGYSFCQFPYNMDSWVDLNNDGLMDFYAIGNYEDHYEKHLEFQNADGTLTKTAMELITTATPDSTLLEQWDRPYYGSAVITSGVPDMGKEMFVGDGDPINNEQLSGIDVNKDGFIDLVSSSTIFYNLGENRYSVATQPGEFVTKDVNGDGILDFIYNDKESGRVYTRIYQGGGEWKEQTLMSDIELSKIFCYDFDKDEDVDILLTFDYNPDFQYSFLVFCENEGNGNFIIHENAYTTEWTFWDCMDIDNDGYLEVLASISNEKSVYLFEDISGNGIVEPKNYLITGCSFGSVGNPHTEFFDINNDGYVELISQYYPPFSINELSDYRTIPANQAPFKMNMPTVYFDELAGKLKVSWEKGSDRESSSIDLTYALRVGSYPGGNDICYADANANGSRRSFMPGNMGSNTETILDVSQWNVGDYYISVQAIDVMGMGSAWSDEIVFHHDWEKKDFTLSSNFVEAADSLIITLSPRFDLYDYQWDIEDGRVVKVSEDGSRYHVLFDKAGVKKIVLKKISKDTGEEILVSKTVTSQSNGFAASVDDSVLYGTVLFDINGDGNLDIVKDDGFYTNDGTGKFSKLSTIFNSNLTVKDVYGVLDFDMDGDLDILAYATNKGNLLQNNGPSSFEGKQVETFLDAGTWVDLNNDGYFDRINDYDGEIRFNAGDNKTYYTVFKLNGGGRGSKMVYDINNDGFKDILYLPEYDVPMLLWNNGDGSFRIQELDESFRSIVIGDIADINNDGYVDLIIMQNNRVITVIMGSEDNTYEKKYSYLLSKDFDDMIIFDVNNDGVLDFLFWNNRGDGSVIYLKESMDFWQEDYINGIDDGDIWDRNCDGFPDMSFKRIMKSHSQNSVPESPQNIRVTQKSRSLVVEWDASYDKETPACKMGYDICIRKKGEVGAGSYVMSSLIGSSGNVKIVGGGQSKDYTYATRKEIPLQCFEPGVEYEIRMQSIDLWGAVSPVSEPYIFRVENSLYLDGVSETVVGKTVKFTCGGTDVDLTSALIDLDGGTLISQSRNVFSIVWETSGTKNVSVEINGMVAQKTIVVREQPEMSFTLPSYGYVGIEYDVMLPQYYVDALTSKKYIDSSDSQLFVKEQDGRNAVTVMFSTPGGHWVELHVEDELFGDLSYRVNIEVQDRLPVPVISLVKVDEATGKNMILWQMPDLSGDIAKVNVYKEGSVYNRFDYIGSANPSEGQFVDVHSNPKVSSNRYMLKYQTVDGCESEGSNPHTGIHLMLNRGIGSAVNLMWSQYEGGNVETFTILRGKTETEMVEIGRVAGSVCSYTDLTTAGEDYFYALSFDNVQIEEFPIGRFGQKSHSGGRSNVVSTKDINNFVLATQLNIVALEDDVKLMPEQRKLHFSVELLPTNVDVRNVQWQLLEGSDLAEINQNGLLVAKGNKNGTIIVRATTKDGSNISAEVSVRKEGFVVIPEGINILSENGEAKLTPEQNTLQLKAEVYPDGASQNVVWSIIDGNNLATITQQGLLEASGNANGMIIVRAESKDYSDVYGLFTIEKEGFVIIPKQVSIKSVNGMSEISPENPKLQLEAEVFPIGAPQTVEWSIVSGESLASISETGLLEATGLDDGIVRVRATSTIDWSVYDDFDVTKHSFSGINETKSEDLRYWVNSNLYVTGFPTDVEIRLGVMSVDGILLRAEKHRGEGVICVNIQNLSKGVYMLVVEYGNEHSIFKFIKSE